MATREPALAEACGADILIDPVERGRAMRALRGGGPRAFLSVRSACLMRSDGTRVAGATAVVLGVHRRLSPHSRWCSSPSITALRMSEGDEVSAAPRRNASW